MHKPSSLFSHDELDLLQHIAAAAGILLILVDKEMTCRASRYSRRGRPPNFVNACRSVRLVNKL